jgi:hypothetical protein
MRDINYTAWFKKMNSILYVYISLTIHGMWIIYTAFERGGPKCSNTIARALAYRTAVQQRQLRAKWLLCSHVSRSPLIHVVGWSFCLYTDSLFAVIPTTNALPRWRLNVETKTKCPLHSSRQVIFNELTNVKDLVLHSRHFVLNWRCCTAVR